MMGVGAKRAIGLYRSCAPRHQLDSNGTARVGGGHRGVTEIVRSLESTFRNVPARGS